MFREKYAPFAEGGFPTPSGQVRVLLGASREARAWIRCRRTSRRTKRRTAAPLARRYPLAMISPPARNFLNSTFVNVTSLRDDRRRADRRDASARRALRAASSTALACAMFNDRGSIDVLARVTDRARPGCVVALSIWWKKLARDGKNANELTSQSADRHRPRADVLRLPRGNCSAMT